MTASNDIVVLGDKGSHLFKFGTNGLAVDVSIAEPLERRERDSTDVLMDLDFTGKAGLDRGDREHQ